MMRGDRASIVVGFGAGCLISVLFFSADITPHCCYGFAPRSRMVCSIFGLVFPRSAMRGEPLLPRMGVHPSKSIMYIAYLPVSKKL